MKALDFFSVQEIPLEARRGELPYQRSMVLQPWLEGRLKAIDKSLECMFLYDSWELYAVKLYGVTPASDLLIHQFSLHKEPGNWLIQRIQENLAINTLFGKCDSEETRREFRRRMQTKIVLDEIRREDNVQRVAASMREAMDHILIKRKVVTSRANKRKKSKARSGWQKLEIIAC